MARVKFRKQAFPEIMQSAGARAAVKQHVDATTATLNADDYGSTVQSGGDRIRGAVWTKTAAGKRRTAKDGELLKALK